ncbi:MAG: helix-turn-helix domain-containing protein [Promethearchaeota archaeon]
MPPDIVQIRLEIDIPNDKWLFKFNEKYPELNFYILSKFLIEDNAGITLFQIRGLSIKQFISDFKKQISKNSSQILFEGDDLAIMNIRVVDPWILNTLIKTELLILYPILIKEGKIRIEAITNRSKVDDFLTELEKKGIKASIGRIGYGFKSTLLTQRHFDIPRKISLTEFANNLNISKSALSETLRRIFKRLSDNYIKFSN